MNVAAVTFHLLFSFLLTELCIYVDRSLCSSLTGQSAARLSRVFTILIRWNVRGFM
jgi:hypothetical protein